MNEEVAVPSKVGPEGEVTWEDGRDPESDTRMALGLVIQKHGIFQLYIEAPRHNMRTATKRIRVYIPIRFRLMKTIHLLHTVVQ